jgi:ABC-type uncharacterized transport system permease subunit
LTVRGQVAAAAGRAAVAAVVTVAAVAGLCAAIGVPPVTAVKALVTGAFGEPFNPLAAKATLFAWRGTLLRTTPILLTGLSVAWAFRAGLFNIGAEGQLLWGAVAAAWVGIALHLPPAVHVPLALAAGALAGALWAWPAAALKARRNASEVLTTLLLSFVAIQLTTFIALRPLHDPTQQGPRTADLRQSANLPSLTVTSMWRARAGAPLRQREEPAAVQPGFLIAAALAATCFAVLQYSRYGFQLKVVGQNPEAARSGGMDVPRVWSRALLQSGALAGLAGAIEILGVHHYFQAGFSPGYGYEGIAVAILGGNNPLGVVLASLFWGGLANGAVEMELNAGVNRYLVTVIQAVVVLVIAVRRWPSLPAIRSSAAPRDRTGSPAPDPGTA